jgi:hypothetical protein
MSAKAILSASVSAPPAVYVEDVFSTFLYTGNGSTQTITNGIDLSGKGGLVWIKGRSVAYDHYLQDTTRGANKILFSNQTLAEQNDTNAITTFNSTGWDMDAESGINANNQTFASWTFRKQPKFFDVVTYTGTGSSLSISHNLGSEPGFLIIKRTNGSGGNWPTYHRSLGIGFGVLLNLTNENDTRPDITAVSSTTFTVSGSQPRSNESGGTYVAYLFAHDAGGFGTAGTDNVVSCGSFTSDGSNNATVTLGWEPQWLLFKRTDSTGSWALHDTMRGGSLSASSNGLSANTSEAEGAGTSNYAWNPTATGFQFRASLGGSGATYIYIAIRRGPMKTPTVGTGVYTEVPRTGTGAVASVTGVGFAPDLVVGKRRSADDEPIWFDRLRGATNYLYSSATDAEATDANSLTSFDMDGFTLGTDVSWGKINFSGRTYANWAFRRAPGFFDVVAYTGTGSTRTVSHNLGVVPELMIVKARNLSGLNWPVYSALTGNTNWLRLNTTDASASATGMWNSTSPTASVFTVGTSAASNDATGTFIAYLFATLAGVSKVGSYTGTGTTLQINCGFTAGARFVMIKRTDSTGDWYVWDTARGIISGNDPYLLLNSIAAEVTGTDYIDPLSSGFEISSTAPAAINANGGSFIFLAIA